ncbi:MAG: hypothetical protein V1729_00330 [Candidatus Woesearchaeota archaeon]
MYDKMETEKPNLYDLLSTTGDWILKLNSPDDRREKGEIYAKGIFCNDARALTIINSYVPELCREDTPIIKGIGNTAYKKMGSLSQVLTQEGIRPILVDTEIRNQAISAKGRDNEGIKMDGMNRERAVRSTYNLGNEISDILEEMDSRSAVKTDDVVDTANRYDNPKKTARFFEASIYDKIFKSRKELGLSIDYSTDPENKGNESMEFRYVVSENRGSKGRRTSKEYVKEAMSAIRTYDSIMKSGQIDDLKRAMKIAKEYFTKEDAAESCEKIVRQMYKTLIFKNDENSIADAYELAKTYFKGDELKRSLDVITTLSNRRYVKHDRQSLRDNLLLLEQVKSESPYKDAPVGARAVTSKITITPPPLPESYLNEVRVKKAQQMMPLPLPKAYLDSIQAKRAIQTPPPLPESYLNEVRARKASQTPPPLPESYLASVRTKKDVESRIISLAEHRQMRQKEQAQKHRKIQTRNIAPVWVQYLLPSMQKQKGNEVKLWSAMIPPPLPSLREYRKAA